MNFILVITGPTAVGKTDFALKIAESIPSEIINADVGQCYAPLTIGTAKPDWRNSPIPHHMFDIIDTPANITVVEFRKRLLETATDIIARGRLPIVVGGSAFYIKSLFFPPQSVSEVASSEWSLDKNSFWDQLYAIDPERANKIHKNDVYRINRALAIWKQTGKQPSSFSPDYQPPMPFRCIIFTRDRDELYQRIDTRVPQMLEQGWIEEVRALQSTDWEPFLQNKKIIGYDVVLHYLNEGSVELDKQEMIALIQKKTRNYAKRQLTFFKTFEKQLSEAILKKHDQFDGLEGKVEVVNLTLMDVDLYIKQLLQNLSSMLNKTVR